MAREMNDSGIAWVGEIPSEWHTEKHKYLFSCGKEIVGTSSKSTQLLSLTTQGVKKKSSDAVGGKLPESFDTYQIVEENNLIMCLFDLDCSAVFSGLSPFCGMISPAYKVLKCSAKILPKFADYWFKFVFDGRKFKSYAKNLRYTLNYDEFSCIPMALPNLEEQLRIAMFLDRKCAEIDSVIADTQRTIEEYKKLKQSVITQAVTKGIRGERPMKDSGIAWIGTIPAEWDVVRLKSLFGFGKGLPITKENLVETGIPVISYGQIHSKMTNGVELQQHLFRYVDEAYLDANPQSLVHQGDFIFADTSEDFDGCGNAVYINEELTLFAGYHTIILSSKDSTDNKYIAYQFQTDLWRSQIRSRVSGVKVFSISRKILGDATIILPLADEREKIVAYLDEKCDAIDRIIAAKQQLIAEMESYKKSVIYEYVTGKKEVTV